MFPLETKKSEGKLLPHSDLGGGVFLEEVSRSRKRNRDILLGSHWGDQDVDGRIILRWIFRKLERVVRTGWSWLRIGTGGGHL
jgi:hypothetical protein